MEHDIFRNDLPLYATGDLAPAEAARLEDHLAACAACRRELEETRAALGRLRDAGAADGADVDLRDLFDERIGPRLARRRGWGWGWGGAAARTAALLLAFVAGMAVERLASRGNDDARPPSASSDVPERLKAAQGRSNLARALHALAAMRD